MNLLQINDPKTVFLTNAEFCKISIIAIVLITVLFFIVRNYSKSKAAAEAKHYRPFDPSELRSVRMINTSSELEGAVVNSSNQEFNDPIKTMASGLTIPCWRIKVSLGIPITATCDATTAEDAHEAYKKAKNNSDEEYVAILKWIELEENLDIMSDLDSAVSDYFDLKVMLYSKWNALALIELYAANTYPELLSIWPRIPEDTEAQTKFIQKIYEFYK